MKDQENAPRRQHHSYAYKMEIVDKIETGQMSRNQAAKMYGLNFTTVSNWCKKYANFDRKLREMGGKSPKDTISELRGKLKTAESENAVLKAVMAYIKEEGGEEMLKKHLPEQFLKTLPSKKKG